MLEQGAWAGYARVDEVSRNKLGMKTPSATDLVLIGRDSGLKEIQLEQVKR